MGGVLYQGLNYPSVMAVITAFGIKKQKRVFKQVQLIEAGALSVLNDRKNISDNPVN